MSTFVLTDARIWVDQFDFSGDMNAIALSEEADAKDATVFGVGTRVRAGGLHSVDVQAKGYVNQAGSEQSFTNLAGIGVPFTIAPQGPAVGNAAFFMAASWFKYVRDLPLGELIAFTLDANAVKDQTDGTRPRLVRGSVMLSTTKSATGSEAVQQLGAVSASQKLYAALHVFSYSGGGSLVMRIQSASTLGFGSPTTRATFVTQLGGGSDMIVPVAGAITDQYWRADWTFTGSSFLAAVVAGIR